jgi:hypothetical protein
MTALIKQSPGIMTDRNMAGRQLEVLNCLLRQAQSHRLLLGADIFDAPAAVSDLLLGANPYGENRR